MSPGISPELQSKLCSKMPEAAANEAIKFFIAANCKFSFSVSRKSKLGDYRPGRGLSRPTITVNSDLHPQLFLLTFLHELAHVLVYDRYPRLVHPHGEEWKSTYRELLRPFLREEVFGDRLQLVFDHYREAPATWTHRQALSSLIPGSISHYDGETVADLQSGDRFKLMSGRAFELGQKRRTRYLCKDLSNSKQYLVHQDTPVERLI